LRLLAVASISLSISCPVRCFRSSIILFSVAVFRPARFRHFSGLAGADTKQNGAKSLMVRSAIRNLRDPYSVVKN
jgi:hypothetical protein